MTAEQVRILKYISIVIVIIFSFFASYLFFIQEESYDRMIGENHDKLSSESYEVTNTVQLNPYIPDFIGFNSLLEAGVSNEDMTYIYDYLTNFMLYNKRVYNGKVSYVKDSFTRGQLTDDGYVQYSFKFGINNSNIHTANIRSNWVDSKISIQIKDTDDQEVIKRDFIIY